MAKKTETKPQLDFDQPLRLENHKRPVTRRDFISQGLVAGGAAVIGPSLLGLLGPKAYAAVTEAECGIVSGAGGGKVPFIAFDLSGGANIAGSNVLVGGATGQMEFLSDAGYEKLGLPANMLPSLAGQTATLDVGGLGLVWHADSALLRGIRQVASQATLDKVNGSIMCARSSNDTSDNPHNPMYGIYKAGGDGDIVSLIGSRSSDSGGRSVAPESMIDLSVRPTKIASGNDARGLIDTGKLAELLPAGDATSVMQAIERISELKLNKIQEEAAIEQAIQCSYLESTQAASGAPGRTDIDLDSDLQAVFTAANLDIADFQKTASVSKLVLNGLAGAGTVQFGGYDYHDSTRTTGDARDERAGREIGAVLEYASRLNGGAGQSVMIYVFSDGSVASNGTLDSTGKGIWKGDNSSTSASLMLVYDPAAPQGAPPAIVNNNQQIGYFRASGSIETNATVISNNVDQLAEAVVLNYMALNSLPGEIVTIAQFSSVLPNHGLGANQADLNALTAFAPLT